MSDNGQNSALVGTLLNMINRLSVSGLRRPVLYHGWLVVAAAFLVAFFGFGLGFYGPGLYLWELEARHGWPIAELAPAITVYYALDHDGSSPWAKGSAGCCRA